jgi:hypothetical protein
VDDILERGDKEEREREKNLVFGFWVQDSLGFKLRTLADQSTPHPVGHMLSKHNSKITPSLTFFT